MWRQVPSRPAVDRLPTRTDVIILLVAQTPSLGPYMLGWRSYFGFCETPDVLIGLTRWVRLRLGGHVATVENTAPSPVCSS